MPFAAALLKGDKQAEDCIPLLEPKNAQNLEKLRSITAPMKQATANGIILNEESCDGCGICVIACPVNPRFSPECMSGKAPEYPLPAGIIYALENGKCKIKSIEECRRYTSPRINCRVCEIFCPRFAIEIKT